MAASSISCLPLTLTIRKCEREHGLLQLAHLTSVYLGSSYVLAITTSLKVYPTKVILYTTEKHHLHLSFVEESVIEVFKSLC